MTAALAQARPTADERIRAALWFAERGFGVFSVWSTDADGTCRCSKKRSCTSPGKHPIPPKGFDDSTTDVTRIRTMLSAASEPNYGLLPPPEIFVLDVDGDDVDRLARLEAQYGPLPSTLRTRTANGQHIFLRWPSDRPRPIHKMFGLVTRWGSGAQAGYVVGPRSVHASGAEYEPIGGMFEIAELPARWVQAVLDGQTPAVRIGGPKELPSVGHRHDWLRDRARHYWGLHGDRELVRALLVAENARLPQPKTIEEVERAIGEVEKFPVDPPEEVEERAERKLGGDDESDLLGLPPSSEFPADPAPVAFEGTLGEMLEDIESGTDASRVGLLGALIAIYGALMPGRAYFHREQTSSPFVALIGESAVGRKGTAMYRALDAAGRVHGVDVINRMLVDGIQSGEGLVAELHQRREYDRTVPTVGLIFEEEYASLLAARGRDNSTLDPKMRLAFDGGPLSNRKVTGRTTVSPPYWLPALVAITPVELRDRVEQGFLQTGSGNRWVYLPVRRRDLDATNQPPEFRYELHEKLAERRSAVHRSGPEVPVDKVVAAALSEYADWLAANTHGIAYDLTKRYSAIALRIALIHALVDGERIVGPDHIERSIALMEYARRGIGWVFGDTVGDPKTALLYRHLVEEGHLSSRAISRLIRRPEERQAAVDELLRIGRAQRIAVMTRGRTRHELALVPDLLSTSGPFVPYVLLSRKQKARNAGQRDGSAQTAGQKVDGSGTEGGRKPVETASETVACHYYLEHQSHHVRRGNRWICPICEPSEGAA